MSVITPFNFPLEIPVLQLMGALYMGNKPVLKVDSKVSSKPYEGITPCLQVFSHQTGNIFSIWKSGTINFWQKSPFLFLFFSARAYSFLFHMIYCRFSTRFKSKINKGFLLQIVSGLNCCGTDASIAPWVWFAHGGCWLYQLRWEDNEQTTYGG